LLGVSDWKSKRRAMRRRAFLAAKEGFAEPGLREIKQSRRRAAGIAAVADRKAAVRD
jgi:hypothetical protein